MSRKSDPPLSLFFDILQTLETINAAQLGEDVAELWQAIKTVAQAEAEQITSNERR